jgi:hypothetical protein
MDIGGVAKSGDGTVSNVGVIWRAPVPRL